MDLTTSEMFRFGGVAVAALVVYAFLWKKNRPLALAILLTLVGYLLYYTVNWNSVRKSTFISWGGGGIAAN